MMTPAFLLALASLAPNGDASEPTLKPLTLVPIVQGEDETNKPWAGSVNVGFTRVSGNTNTISGSMTANATRENGHNRYKVRSFYHYEKQEGVLNERNAGLVGQYDYLAGEDYYYFLLASIETDVKAMLDTRYVAGGGVGYTFIENDKTELNGQVGVTYFVEEFEDGSDSNEITLALGYDLKHAFSERTRFKQDFEAFPAVNDLHDVFMRLDSRLETNLTDRMLGAAQYTVDWDNTPAPGAENTDHRIVLTLGWSFGG